MSRIGKQPISIPSTVKLSVAEGVVRAEGPKGKLEHRVDELVDVKVEGDQLICSPRDLTNPDCRARFGLTRSLLANMVHGVSVGFLKELDVVGVGYRAAVKGKVLDLSLGYSHPIAVSIPDGINVVVEKNTRIKISGPDRCEVGELAAEIRHLRLPEPYKGKGVKYADERVRRKAGKAAGAGAAG